jgi:hypothetical protein
MTNTDILHPLTSGMKSRTPEQCLLAAVLEDAIDVYRHPRADRRELMRETEAWLGSDDPSWLFSFARICQTLGLDPHAIRASLEQERLGHMRAA